MPAPHTTCSCLASPRCSSWRRRCGPRRCRALAESSLWKCHPSAACRCRRSTASSSSQWVWRGGRPALPRGPVAVPPQRAAPVFTFTHTQQQYHHTHHHAHTIIIPSHTHHHTHHHTPSHTHHRTSCTGGGHGMHRSAVAQLHLEGDVLPQEDGAFSRQVGAHDAREQATTQQAHRA